MVDREKVKKGLECHKSGICDNNKMLCPYWKEEADCSKKLIDDALELLKEQEAEIEKLTRYINGFSRDAIPVVRCNDCENKECWGRAGDVVCGIDGTPHRPDWFCADGERRTDDG